MNIEKKELERIKKEFDNCKNSCEYFVCNYIKVIHPIRGLVKFDLYPFQKKILSEFQQNRLNILKKFRQAGCTTLMGAYALWFIIFHANKKVVVLSKGDDEAKEVLSRIKVMYEELPFWLKPKSKKDNDHRLDLENRSSIQSKASSKQSGRSLSASLLIIDEGAFIEHIDTIWAAVGPVISTGGRCCVLSTVNGIGNWFHKMWMQADAAGGSINGFNPVQIHWKEHPEYFRHTEYEWLYQEMASYTPPIYIDQWESLTRRKHSEKEWLQEYEASFLGTGDTYIDGEILKSLKMHCNSEYTIKYNNRMRVWKQPMPYHEYVIGVDPSIGRERDYSAFHIIDLYNGEQVAEFYSNKTTLDDLAKIVAAEGRLYNTAFVIPERNAIGNNLIYFLKETLEYENLVYDENRDIGVQVTQKNREILLANMENAIRTARLKINSERLVEELLTFVIDPETGKIEADVNCHDDLISALSLCVHAFNNIVGTTPMERDSLIDKLSNTSPGIYSTKYNMRTATGGTSEEDISWLIKN